MTTTVTIERWTRWRGVNQEEMTRYSIMFEGQTVITRLTELECRRYAREMNWTVDGPVRAETPIVGVIFGGRSDA